jgi:hypothetical protein
MRTYYRLVILNLIVMVALTVAIFHHIVKINLMVALAVLILPFANYIIARKVFRQGGILSLQNKRWGFGAWSAWATGPAFVAMLPLAITGLIIRPDFEGIIGASCMFFGSLSTLAKVPKSQQEQDELLVQGSHSH